LLFSRFEIEDGNLAGYNRENGNFINWFDKRTLGDYFFFGYSGKIEYAASWRWALVQWGVIPCFIYFFMILLNAIRLRLPKRDLVLLFSILIIIFIQRPFLTNYFYVFLIVVPQFYLSSVQDKLSIKTNII